MSVRDLPLVNACINVCVFLLLLIGYVLIRRQQREAHKWVMLGAVTLSAIFLASYVTYHALHGSTKFTGQGPMRTVYFTILITHTILAVVNLPFVIITLYRAWKGQFAAHRRVAKRTWAIWMYVAATGPIVYFMLYQMYPAPSAEAAFLAARALHHDQKDKEAFEAYQRASELGSVDAKCYAAVLQDRLQETNAASAAIDAVLASAPDNAHCRVLKARELIYANRFAEAVTILEDAVKRVPADAFFWASLGFAQYRMQNYRPAALAFEKSVELDPTLPANLFNAGYAHFLDGQYTKAIPLLEKAIALPLDDELKARAKESLEVISGALWVCPMHPERTGKAGEKCPDCGMALEPNPHGLDERDEQ